MTTEMAALELVREQLRIPASHKLESKPPWLYVNVGGGMRLSTIMCRFFEDHVVVDWVVTGERLRAWYVDPAFSDKVAGAINASFLEVVR